MAKDKRTFVWIHDGMPHNIKISPLSDSAFRLYVESICHCGKYLTDGFILTRSMAGIGPAKARTELLAAGLLIEDTHGFWIHDYLHHNRSREEVEAMRERQSQNGSKGGRPPNPNESQTKATGLPKRKPLVKPNRNPNESQTKAYTDTDTTKDLKTTEKDMSIATRCSADSFDDFWKVYPRKESKPAALKAWTKAIKRAKPATIIEGAARHRDDPNREQKYTKHPATWLTNDGWADPLLPSRNGHKPSPSEGWLTLAAAKQAQPETLEIDS